MKRLWGMCGVAFLTALLGVAAGPIGGGFLEEFFGLEILFMLRGERTPPPQVLIVSTDRRMDAPKESRWAVEKPPRSLYAKLVETLDAKGAKAVCFDINFNRPGEGKEDRMLAESIGRAGNVLLHEDLEITPLLDGSGRRTGLYQIKHVPPLAQLAEASVACAPFPLPKKPARMARYWTFKPDIDDAPTLPTILFFFYCRHVHEEFYKLLEHHSGVDVAGLFQGWRSDADGENIQVRIQTVRKIFENDPSLIKKMIDDLKSDASLERGADTRRLLRSLIGMFRGDDRYLNFYGPPGSIRTISSQRVLEEQTEGEEGLFAGKAVLIGLSELYHPKQQDGFFTVYSRPDGVDLCGVEILATAFANILEGFPVEPVSFRNRLLSVAAWGAAVGAVCRYLPTLPAALATLGAVALWTTASFYRFKHAGVWHPLVVPVALQVPFAFFLSVVWKNCEIKRERKKIRTAFGYYIPDHLVDRLVENIGDIRNSHQMVHGTCMFTDAMHFTNLSESVSPMELGRLMNLYYDEISRPIAERGGIVSRIVGDSMLVVWASLKPDPDQGRQACHAALEISAAIRRSRQRPEVPNLPTRIGVHGGRFFYGNIGSEQHYDYTPMGDAVNSASRLEGLNKKLGTWILVSDDVLRGVDDVLHRKVGDFLLSGKNMPMTVHELLCRKDEANDSDQRLCDAFALALNDFAKRNWDSAASLFRQCQLLRGKDGPSSFYIALCGTFQTNPPEGDWSGIVKVGK